MHSSSFSFLFFILFHFLFCFHRSCALFRVIYTFLFSHRPRISHVLHSKTHTQSYMTIVRVPLRLCQNAQNVFSDEIGKHGQREHKAHTHTHSAYINEICVTLNKRLIRPKIEHDDGNNNNDDENEQKNNRKNEKRENKNMKKKKKETKQRTKKRDFVFFLRFVRRECANAERQTKKTTAICMCMCVCVCAMRCMCFVCIKPVRRINLLALAYILVVCARCVRIVKRRRQREISSAAEKA